LTRHRLSHEKAAGKVHIDYAAPLVFFEFKKRFFGGNARDVGQLFNSAEAIDALLDCLLHGPRIGHIQSAQQYGSLLRPKLPQLFFVQIDQNEICAFSLETSCDRLASPAGRTGDEHDFAIMTF